MKRPDPDTALGYALQIVEAYAREIAARPDLMREGFCQGTIFANAETDILRRMKSEYAGREYRDPPTSPP